MKSKFLIWALVLFSSSCATNGSDDGYVIRGTIQGLSDGTILLQKAGAFLGYTYIQIDSMDLKDGSFMLTGKVDYPEMYYLRIADRNEVINVFLENSNITINTHIDNFSNSSVSGSTLHKELESFTKQLDQSPEREQSAFIESYIQENNSSEITPYLILKYLANSLELEELETLVSKLDKSFREMRYFEQLMDRIEVLRDVAIGQPAPDFTLLDTSGTPISLSSLNAKYLLIDFWASWCGPCRAENPNLVSLYSSFKNKGFEIIGVGLEFSRDNWLKAIRKDNLPWPNVSAVNAFSGPAASLYGVRQLPHNVIINSEGTIIEKNLHGDMLRAFLEQNLAHFN